MPNIYKKLALEGGGTKGHIYMGAALELEKLGVLDSLESVAGASVGAIAALLFATGRPISKIQEMYSKMDFKGMAEGGWVDTIMIPHHLRKNYGAYTGQQFHDWFRNIIQEVTGNPDATFEDWHKLKLARPDLKLKDLFVEACNMDTEFNETFSYQSQHHDVPIADAVFASMKFPGFFTPHIIKGHRFFDSGTQRNCPSEIFEKTHGQFDPEVLTIRLDSQNEINYYERGIIPPPKPPKNIFQALGAIIGAATKSQDYTFQNSPYKAHTIFGSTLNAGTLDFDMPKEEQQALVESGKYSVMSYFHKHHPDLTVGKYDPKVLSQLEKYNYPVTITDFNNAVAARKQAKVTAQLATSSTIIGTSTFTLNTSVGPAAPTFTPMRTMQVVSGAESAAMTPANSPTNPSVLTPSVNKPHKKRAKQ